MCESLITPMHKGVFYGRVPLYHVRPRCFFNDNKNMDKIQIFALWLKVTVAHDDFEVCDTNFPWNPKVDNEKSLNEISSSNLLVNQQITIDKEFSTLRISLAKLNRPQANKNHIKNCVHKDMNHKHRNSIIYTFIFVLIKFTFLFCGHEFDMGRKFLFLVYFYIVKGRKN